ncbi:hypothetical protein JCM10213_005446 [Rhodosporidiobolus nylandii]
MDMSSMDHGSHAGMDMGSGSDSTEQACKISMLWNWYTTDACFLSEQWHIRSVGDYVGTLIGIFFIVVALEAVRRLGREYDRAIRRAYYRREEAALEALKKNAPSKASDVGRAAPFRPSLKEHLIRSTMYMVQFGTAYILMLLAMYFNGGIILAIIAGGGVGYALFARDTATPEGSFLGDDSPAARGECCC